jgi:hypothetical protein
MRPAVESSAGFWTDRDDLSTVLRLLDGGRLHFKEMIGEVHSPTEAGEVYTRLVNDPLFPVGVLFDWSKI